MTKADLIDHVADSLGNKFTKKETAAAVQAVFDALRQGIKGSGRMQYPDFGTFTVAKREARQGRNPRTNQPMEIAASQTVRFKPAPKFKETL